MKYSAPTPEIHGIVSSSANVLEALRSATVIPVKSEDSVSSGTHLRKPVRGLSQNGETVLRWLDMTGKPDSWSSVGSWAGHPPA